jgi:hypothetical protein
MPEDATTIKGSTDQHHSVFWLEQQVGMHQTLLTCRSQAWEMGTGNKPFSVCKNTLFFCSKFKIVIVVRTLGNHSELLRSKFKLSL